MLPPEVRPLPAYGVAPVLVGAATQAAARPFGPADSTLDLTIPRVVNRANVATAGLTVTLSAVRQRDESPVAAVTAVPAPGVAGVAGAYRATLPPGALPRGTFWLYVTVTGPDGTATTRSELVIGDSAGVSGLAAPFATAPGGAAPTGARWRRPPLGGPTT